MEGHELLIISRSFKKDIESKQLVRDILNFDDFSQELSWGPQVIIHTAWITTHGVYANDYSNYKYARFTSNLANSVADIGVAHLIILGTCAEYGPQVLPSTAGITKLNPVSLYAKQKVEALNSSKNLLLKSNTRLTWARVFQPYGPHQVRNRLLPYLIDSIKADKKIDLIDTSSVLDWISTRDIASAISWIIHHDTPAEIDVGTTIGFTNTQLIEHLEALIGKTSRWEPSSTQLINDNNVSLVGKDSPLFTSGWRPNDNLNSGLDWVLGYAKN